MRQLCWDSGPYVISYKNVKITVVHASASVWQDGFECIVCNLSAAGYCLINGLKNGLALDAAPAQTSSAYSAAGYACDLRFGCVGA